MNKLRYVITQKKICPTIKQKTTKNDNWYKNVDLTSFCHKQ
jgi:hypothetical protein